MDAMKWMGGLVAGVALACLAGCGGGGFEAGSGVDPADDAAPDHELAETAATGDDSGSATGDSGSAVCADAGAALPSISDGVCYPLFTNGGSPLGTACLPNAYRCLQPGDAGNTAVPQRPNFMSGDGGSTAVACAPCSVGAVEPGEMWTCCSQLSCVRDAPNDSYCTGSAAPHYVACPMDLSFGEMAPPPSPACVRVQPYDGPPDGYCCP